MRLGTGGSVTNMGPTADPGRFVIASLGDIAIDLVVDVEHFPTPGEETWAPRAVTGLGGSAVNTAVNLGRLGFETTMLAQIGDDQFGEVARRSLRELRVGTERVRVEPSGPTGMNIVIVDPQGERSMIGVRGVNPAYPGSEGWEDECGWLHLSAYALLAPPQRDSAEAVVETARSRGIPVSVDVPSGVARTLGERLLPVLAGATVVALGRRSLPSICPDGDGVERLLESGVDTLAISDGEHPFEIHRRGQWVRLTPPQVEVVDTTGAGDSFMAGLVAASLWGMAPGPMAAVAAMLGAAATQREGAGNRPDVALHLDQFLDPAAWTDIEPSWLEAAAARL